MFTSAVLLDLHTRAHTNLEALLANCRKLSDEELHRELRGFGYPTVQLQLHHVIGAELYWTGVLQGRIDAEDNAPEFPTVASLETFREEVFATTVNYLRGASPEELNTVRKMVTWGGHERDLMPAHVVMRPLMHIYHHAGQICAMCRLMDKPTGGVDFPIVDSP